jgi:hypothetical protein
MYYVIRIQILNQLPYAETKRAEKLRDWGSFGNSLGRWERFGQLMKSAPLSNLDTNYCPFLLVHVFRGCNFIL